MRILVVSFLLFLMSFSCSTVKSVFKDESMYNKYVHSLNNANLSKTAMVEEWLEAGKRVFKDSLTMGLPYTESGFISGNSPQARSYRFEVKNGQILQVQVKIKSKKEDALVFLDLFKLNDDNEWKEVTDSDTSGFINYEFNKNTVCLLRLQPELLADVYYAVEIQVAPALINPVSNASNKSIGSLYGDPRDGGARTHEGVDIFAKKGTPVVAPADGYVTRIGTNNLGGKVIWMRDNSRGHSYYFAHLDSQIVRDPGKIKQGDTIGLVGNTGNARTTPPHLHFGVYHRHSIDPLYYIQQMQALKNETEIDTAVSELAFVVNKKKINMRSGAGTNTSIIRKLPQHSYVCVIGKSSDWQRVMLPDLKQGFIHENLLNPLGDVHNSYAVSDSVKLFNNPVEDALPVTFLPTGSKIDVLATFDNFNFVKTEDGKTGWVPI